MKTQIFEIKNGVYNIQQFKEVKDPNHQGNMFIENGYKVFFLVFDKRYPEENCLLIEADKFNEFKEKNIPFYFGYPSITRDSGLYTPKGRIASLVHAHFTEHENYSHCYYSD